jgi:hypothetical protein
MSENHARWPCPRASIVRSRLSAQAFTTGMTARNDPGGSLGGPWASGAFFVQGKAPLPAIWAPMPLPGLLQTSSTIVVLQTACEHLREARDLEQFSSFRPFVLLWAPMHREGAASPTPANPRPLQLPAVRRNMRERLPWAGSMLH